MGKITKRSWSIVERPVRNRRALDTVVLTARNGHGHGHGMNGHNTEKAEAPAPIGSVVKIEVTVDNSVNRFRKCPILARIFCSYGEHCSSVNYRRGNFPRKEIYAYVWMNSTLEEIVTSIKMTERRARKVGTILDFQIISLGLQSTRHCAKDAGRICVGEKRPENTKTLTQCRFTPGDFIDVNIIFPQ